MEKIIFGTRQIGGEPSYKNIDENKALELLEYVYEKGIRKFDTAPIYGHGKSEELLGKFLSKNNVRNNVQIITKFGIRFYPDGKDYFDFSSASIKEELEESLRRLQTDYIDIYLLHIPNGEMSVTEVLTTLNELKNLGKIKSYGLCNSYGDFLESFINHELSEIEYIEDFYNLIEKKAEKLIFPYIDNKKHKFLSYSPLYRGVLCDKITISDLIKKNEKAIDRLIKHDHLPLLVKQRKLLEKVSEKKGISLEQLAINFLLGNKRVDNILFGTTKKENLDHFISLVNNNK